MNSNHDTTMKLSALLCALHPKTRVSIYTTPLSQSDKPHCLCIATPFELLDSDSLLRQYSVFEEDIDILLNLNVHTVTFDQNIVKIIVF